jgi:hypothetical protein
LLLTGVPIFASSMPCCPGAVEPAVRLQEHRVSSWQTRSKACTVQRKPAMSHLT